MVFINVTYLPLGFLMPSSPGSTAVRMPIRAPLKAFASSDRGPVVPAHQSASGLLNLVNPASAGARGGLGYHKWPRFTFPLLIILVIVYAIVLNAGVFVPGPVF